MLDDLGKEFANMTDDDLRLMLRQIRAERTKPERKKKTTMTENQFANVDAAILEKVLADLLAGKEKSDAEV